jgi:hypothetical protein
VNIGAFPAFLQDRRKVRTAIDTSANRNDGRGADLLIFAGTKDALLPSVALECMTIERLTLVLVVAADLNGDEAGESSL